MKGRALAAAALAFLGMVDAFYLAVTHSSGPVPCHVVRGCNEVLSSRYSEVAGIPVAWFGALYYVAAFGAAVFEVSGRAGSLRRLFWPAAAALAVSLGLVGIMAFVLKAFCEYCLASAALSAAIFVLAAWRPPPDARG